MIISLTVFILTHPVNFICLFICFTLAITIWNMFNIWHTNLQTNGWQEEHNSENQLVWEETGHPGENRRLLAELRLTLFTLMGDERIEPTISDAAPPLWTVCWYSYPCIRAISYDEIQGGSSLNTKISTSYFVSILKTCTIIRKYGELTSCHFWLVKDFMVIITNNYTSSFHVKIFPYM